MSSPRYVKVSVSLCHKIPKGSSVTDFEGFAESEKVLKIAREIWNTVLGNPEKDPNLWTLWIHWIYQILDTGADYSDDLLVETLTAMSYFLGKDAGVFLRETAK